MPAERHWQGLYSWHEFAGRKGKKTAECKCILGHNMKDLLKFSVEDHIWRLTYFNKSTLAQAFNLIYKMSMFDIIKPKK